MALIRSLTETTFSSNGKDDVRLANAFIQVADALKPLLPLIGAFAAVKFAEVLLTLVRVLGLQLKASKVRLRAAKLWPC